MIVTENGKSVYRKSSVIKDSKWKWGDFANKWLWPGEIKKDDDLCHSYAASSYSCSSSSCSSTAPFEPKPKPPEDFIKEDEFNVD